MLKKIIKILKTKSLKNIFIVSLGTLFSGLLGFTFYIVLARVLNPAEFGMFSLVITTMTIASDILIFGVNTGIIRFVSEYWVKNRNIALSYLKLSLLIKILTALFLVALVVPFSPILSKLILYDISLWKAIVLMILGIVGIILFSYSSHYFQSTQRFFLYNSLNIGANFFRLLILFVFVFIGFLNLNSALASYVLVYFVFIIISIPFLYSLAGASISKKNVVNFFNYSKWIALLVGVSALSSRMDVLLLSRFKSFQDVGIYSVSNNFISIIPQIVGSLGVVIAPIIGGFTNKKELIKYITKIMIVFALISISILVIGTISSFLFIPLLYGETYSQSIYPAIVLLVGQSIFIFSIPIHVGILYFLKSSKIFAFLNIINLFIIFVSGIILIPSFGYIGSALSVTIGQIFNFIAPFIYLRYKLIEKK